MSKLRDSVAEHSEDQPNNSARPNPSIFEAAVDGLVKVYNSTAKGPSKLPVLLATMTAAQQGKMPSMHRVLNRRAIERHATQLTELQVCMLCDAC